MKNVAFWTQGENKIAINRKNHRYYQPMPWILIHIERKQKRREIERRFYHIIERPEQSCENDDGIKTFFRQPKSQIWLFAKKMANFIDKQERKPRFKRTNPWVNCY